jgi:RNA recognition motif-containing protein
MSQLYEDITGNTESDNAPYSPTQETSTLHDLENLLDESAFSSELTAISNNLKTASDLEVDRNKHSTEDIYPVSTSDSDTNNGSTLFVCNIAFTVTDVNLRNLFRNFGQLSNCKIINSNNDQGEKCKRFAFISFVSNLDMKTALSSLHGTILDNRKLIVRVCENRSSSRVHRHSRQTARSHIYSSRSDKRPSRSDKRSSRSDRRSSRSDGHSSRSDRRASRSDGHSSRSDNLSNGCAPTACHYESWENLSSISLSAHHDWDL